MHEMSIALQIIQIAADSVPDYKKDARLESIRLQIGKLSSVVPDSLRFCFKALTANTPMAETELNIEEVPLALRCVDCRIQWNPDHPVFICPKCRSGSIQVISGHELDIISIEISDDENGVDQNASA